MTIPPPESSRSAIVADAFGPVLRRLRQKAGESQASFADLAGIDRTYVSQIERGIRQPTLTVFVALACALGVEPGYLMTQTAKELKVKAPAFWHSLRAKKTTQHRKRLIKGRISAQTHR